MSNIKIIRDSGFADNARKYKVICNGECIGKVGDGETVEFETQPGEQEIYLKIDWCRSNKLNINVRSGELITLQAGSSLRGFKLLFSIVYVTCLPHQYLWLRCSESS